MVGAVIHKEAFERSKRYIQYAKDNSDSHTIITGGNCDDSVGFFVDPTIILTTDPASRCLNEEIFAPILTVYVYEDNKLADTLQLCENHSYGKLFTFSI